MDYAPLTTTGVLRGHIEKWHLLEYIEIASNPQRDRQIQVASVRTALTLGYSLDDLKNIVAEGGKLNNCHGSTGSPSALLRRVLRGGVTVLEGQGS